MWWSLADIVLAAHILLWLFLGAGVVVAVMGWMRRYRKLALVFWPTMAVTLVNLAVPGCILSDLERWLRQIEVPGWSRDMSLARTVSGTVIGYHPPDALFTVAGALLFSLAVYAFVRYHLKDVIARLRRGNR
jgi:hypothetical protein